MLPYEFRMSNRPKKVKNLIDQNPQNYQIFPADSRDVAVDPNTQEEPYYLALSRENYKKQALLESIIREKDCEMKRMAHDHQISLAQQAAQVDFYKKQYSEMMEELQHENREIRESNLQLTANCEHSVANIQKLNHRMQKEKEEFGSKEKRCEELLLKNQNDTNLTKKEFCKLQERNQLLEKELQETRIRADNITKDLASRTRALSNAEAQLQRMNGEKQNLETKTVETLKEMEIYKNYLLTIEENFHTVFSGIARPHISSQSFRFDWMITTLRDCTQQILNDNQQLQSNAEHVKEERDFLKNEHLSIYNTLMREVAILQLADQPNEDSSNSKMLHFLTTKLKESYQCSEVSLLAKTQESQFLGKEVANLQNYITSLKQDKEDLQLSNTRLEQLNKKSNERINNLQKENTKLSKPEYTDSPAVIGGHCFSPARQREPNVVMEKAKQEISNLERDKMFLLSQVESLSRSLKNNHFFQSTPNHPVRRLNTQTSYT